MNSPNVTLSLSKGDIDMCLSRFDKLSMTDFGFDGIKDKGGITPTPLYKRGRSTSAGNYKTIAGERGLLKRTLKSQRNCHWRLAS